MTQPLSWFIQLCCFCILILRRAYHSINERLQITKCCNIFCFVVITNFAISALLSHRTTSGCYNPNPFTKFVTALRRNFNISLSNVHLDKTNCRVFKIILRALRLQLDNSYILASNSPQKLSMGSLPLNASGPSRSLSTSFSIVDDSESYALM